MKVINQPFDAQLGDVLNKTLNNKKWKNITFFSAFAKASGVLRLKEQLLQAKENGATLTSFIGIDLNNTSYEALLNLFQIFDELYIVHVTNHNMTYHSKVYLFEDSNHSGKVFIGSNNLTVGGLWTNFESYAELSFDSKEEIKNLEKLIKVYSNENEGFSKKIKSKEDIEKLLESGLIKSEDDLRIKNPARKGDFDLKEKEKNLFQSKPSISVPHIPSSQTKTKKTKNTKQQRFAPNNERIPIEKIWFQTKKMTGGSGNILDLSKTGKIKNGSAKNTSYETDDSNIVLGGVTFFDVDPNIPLTTPEDETEKDIIINYEGVDYKYSTIKLPTSGNNPNGSWRLQLKGVDEHNNRLTGVDFKNKILTFEKINSHYFIITIQDETTKNLENIIKNSVFVAYNGGSTRARLFGIY